MKQCSIYFSGSTPGAKGIISYIISKSGVSPTFKINKELKSNDNDYRYDPRRTYKDYTYLTAFNIINGEKPFLVYDLYPYSLFPFAYSLSVLKSWSPPIEWTISVSNTGKANDWLVISQPPRNYSICPYSSSSPVCTESSSNRYNTDNSKLKDKSYRYINFTVLHDRYREYNNNKTNQRLLRVQRIEFYGYLIGHIPCYISKACSASSSKLTLFLFVITASK